MSSHYILQVLRAEDVVWASSSRAKPPNLYVKVTLGASVQKTEAINRNASPSWNSTLTLPTSGTSEVEDLTVELKHKSSLLWNQSIGITAITVKDLLVNSASGEVKVELRSSGLRRSSTITGVLFLRMKTVGERQAVRTMLETAESQAAVLQNPAAAVVSDQVEKAEGVATENWDLLQSIIELAKQVDGFVKFMDDVATVHPYLNVTWQVVSSLQKAIKGQVEADTGVVGLVRCMKEIFETVRGLDSLPDKLKNLDDNMVEFFKQSSECCTFIQEYTDHGFIRRMLKAGTHDKILQFKERFNDLRSALTLGTTMHTAFVSAMIMEKVDLDYLERRLKPTEMDASNRPQCLPGTRSKILTEIMDWIFSDMDKNMLWLHGVAGSGKSTISMTIAEYCLGMCRRGAYLFFLRGKSNPNSVIRTIAFWLASFDQTIAHYMTKAVNENNGIGTASLQSQFEKLLLQPLRAAADAMTGPVVVVLDALDECGSPIERTMLVKLLREELPKLPPYFRFIVTSRPEPDLMAAFSTSQSVAAVPLDYTSVMSKSDVNMYLDIEMRLIFRGQEQDLKVGWEQTMETLGKAADGLFIWASTAIKMVEQSDEPAEELKDLVEFCRSRRSGTHSGLVELYDAVMENSGIQWHKPRSREQFSQILGLILFGKALVTPQTIDGLLGFSSRKFLSRLACVLAYSSENRDTPVRLFHTSFSDYLLDPKRKEQRWFIDESEQRSLLPARCFHVMADKLCFNICGLESSFVPNDKVPDLEVRVKERIPSHLQYACQYWAEHICDVSQAQAPSTLLDELKAFVQGRLLYWFEVLSVSKHFDRVANRSLYDASLWAGPNWPDISSLVWSAYRFSSIFSYPMSTSAPHIYLSALSLGMQDFTATEYYSKILPVIRSYRFGTKPSQPCLKILSGHTDSVRSVAFAPGGRRIASGSEDGTVCVWDVDPGKLASGPFEGHRGFVYSVVFSPDGRRIASGSEDRTVRVWDVDSGKLVSGPFKGHAGSVYSVSFSPDGRRIASGSGDGTVRVWDVDSGKLVSGSFEGHAHFVRSMAFSPDGRRIASGSDEGMVRVWDVDSGKLASGPFEGHRGSINSVSFSPDGRRIASGSRDKTVRVWDVDSGKLTSGPFAGHADSVNSVSFSPDGRRIASGSGDNAVRVWDVDSGKLCSGPFEGHADFVYSVSFSPDGRRIASGSRDKTVRVWDVDSEKLVSGPFEGHASSVWSVAFSPDGRRIASGSSDETVRVWDVDLGLLVSGPFEGHATSVRSVAFSPDGRRIASGSEDGTVRVWDVDSGKLASGPFEGHSGSVYSVSFSPDGRRIASGSDDGTMRVWDVNSGKLTSGPFEGHRGFVYSVVFSPDGRRIASGSSDGTVRVWDVDSGKLVSGPFKGHAGFILSVSFSPDGRRIVSGSGDHTVRVWDMDSGKLTSGPFEGHVSFVLSVSFSPDGRRIASCSDDRTVRVWDVDSRKLVSGPFEGHVGPVRSASFSPVGHCIASGHHDGTVRISDGGRPTGMSATTAEHTELKAENIGKSECDHHGSSKSAPRQRGTSPIQEEVCNRPTWTISKDGWLLGKGGELIIWIPEDIRWTLWHPATVAIMSCPFSTKLDIMDAKLGEGWYEGYPSKLSQ